MDLIETHMHGCTEASVTLDIVEQLYMYLRIQSYRQTFQMLQIIESRYLDLEKIKKLCREKWGEDGWRINFDNQTERWTFNLPEKLTEEELERCETRHRE
ncbi:unnamed protein product [Periconia digitata]|uniref:Uncharacterized protein n=1 Tax=Periconia digitata TaxID=1303443 RepID=A0A9W4UN54_9PLEO|nr:unnamed protein product [Periconia digitata]